MKVRKKTSDRQTDTIDLCFMLTAVDLARVITKKKAYFERGMCERRQ